MLFYPWEKDLRLFDDDRIVTMFDRRAYLLCSLRHERHELAGDGLEELLLRVLDGEQTASEVNRQDGIVCLYTTHPAF